MANRADQADAAMETLGDKTAGELVRSLKGFNARDVAAANTRRVLDAGGGSQAVYLYRVKLTDAEIKGLPNAPVTLVAGVDGKMIWPLDTLLICDTTQAPYSNVQAGPQIGIGYSNNNGAQLVPGGFITDSASGALYDVSNLLTYQGVALAALHSGSGVDSTADGMTGFVTVVPHQTWGLTVTPGDEAPYDGLDLELQAVNSDGEFILDFTGGDIANSMIVAVTYAMVDLA